MKELAQEYEFEYDVVTADIDEQALGDRTADPAKLVTLLAQAKAVAICERMQSTNALPLTGLLLTSDQVVICQNRIREKPTSTEEVNFEFIALQWLAAQLSRMNCCACMLTQLFRGLVLQVPIVTGKGIHC